MMLHVSKQETKTGMTFGCVKICHHITKHIFIPQGISAQSQIPPTVLRKHLQTESEVAIPLTVFPHLIHSSHERHIQMVNSLESSQKCLFCHGERTPQRFSGQGMAAKRQ
jgi:hypothetical protein